MNARIKDLWIAALLSGKYKKGTGALRNENKEYCCLGVLCDLFHQETGQGEWEGDYFLTYTTDLPPVVAEWAGIPLDVGAVRLGDQLTMTLDQINDADGSTFGSVAGYIRHFL